MPVYRQLSILSGTPHSSTSPSHEVGDYCNNLKNWHDIAIFDAVLFGAGMPIRQRQIEIGILVEYFYDPITHIQTRVQVSEYSSELPSI